MAVIDIKDATIRFVDGTEPVPKTIDIKIGEGNLTYTETRNREYIRDRGRIDSVRDGDEDPMELSFDLMWEEISATVDAGIATPEDALKQRDDAADWVSSGTDICEPYSVDVELELDAGCVDANGVPVKDREIITFPEYRYESLAQDLRAGTIAVSGNCNALQARIEHATAAVLAAAFDAANNEYLNAADQAALGLTTDFSLVTWIRPSSVTGTQGIVTKWDIGTAHEWALYMSGAKLRFEINAAPAVQDPLGTTYIQSNTDLVADTWYMVTIVYDGAGVGNTGRLQMWLGAAQESSATYAGTVPATMRDLAAELRFGAFETTLNPYTGRIGMTGLWSTQVTAIASLYKGGLGKLFVELTASEKTSLVAWWDMGEANGSRADSHTNAITLGDNATVLSASGVRALKSIGQLP